MKSFSFRMLKTLVLIALILSTHCYNRRKVGQGGNKIAPAPPKKDPNAIQEDRRGAVIDNQILPTKTETKIDPNDVQQQRRNAITENLNDEDIKKFRESLNLPDWAFRLYLLFSAADGIKNQCVQKLQPSPGDEEKIKKAIDSFFSAKFGFEVVHKNAETKVHFLLKSGDYEKELTPDQKTAIKNALPDILLNQICKAALKYLVTKAVEGSITMAIPGVGILILLYKLYNSFKIDFEKKPDGKSLVRVCIDAIDLSDVGKAQVCLEVELKSKILTALHDNIQKLKDWVNGKKTAFKNYFKKKFPTLFGLKKKTMLETIDQGLNVEFQGEEVQVKEDFFDVDFGIAAINLDDL